MAPVKPTKVAVETTDDSDELDDFGLQAAFLFDEFLRLYNPADINNDERRDSPVPMPAPQSYKAVEQGKLHKLLVSVLQFITVMLYHYHYGKPILRAVK